MLEQFVESQNNVRSGARRGKFLITTTMLVGTIFLNGILWSLFAKDLGIANGDLELSSFVAPVTIAETEPLPPEPVKNTEREPTSTKAEIPNRQDNIARIDELQAVPDKLSTTSNGLKARPIGRFTISNQPDSDGNSPTGNPDRGGTPGPGVGISNQSPTKVDDDSNIVEPVAKKPVEPAKKEPVRTVSRGVITGNAKSLPKPIYSAAARALHAAGDVSVQVTIDENGNVIAANAISGHPLLKQASEVAARSAKFSPTFLSDQPVKVTGVIIYKFIAQ